MNGFGAEDARRIEVWSMRRCRSPISKAAGAMRGRATARQRAGGDGRNQRRLALESSFGGMERWTMPPTRGSCSWHSLKRQSAEAAEGPGLVRGEAGGELGRRERLNVSSRGRYC